MVQQLQLVDVEAGYGPMRVLHGISLEVAEGEIVAVLGANGAGKTTILRAISGLIRRRGSILISGQRIDREAPEMIARRGVAHVPQGQSVYAEMTVGENLRLGSYVRRDHAGIAQDYERVLGYFPWLTDRAAQFAGTLSGGEQRMLAIGRAVMMRPRILLLDEPSLGLAPIVIAEIGRLVSTMNRELGVSVLVVEQNARLALRVAHRAYVIESGRVVVEGTSEELSRNELIQRSYLGY